MKQEQNQTMQYATYCPEDNKIRLYVGRVPREEYEKLRADGWTCTPKQDCNFVATWTPSRRDTALAYSGGVIEDEDQTPEDRAADRAERFGGYRDKRTAEAVGHADNYESGPAVHGYQSQARAERSAARHDRQAGYACDAWSKAEYWQQRTAGVISHALYKSTPGVRMGRIKVLEADLRRLGESQGEWAQHYRLRLAYENQMLEAQGGRAAFVEMQVGGWIGSQQIRKVNKSHATGRVVSVTLKVKGQRWGRSEEGFHFDSFNVERLPANAYRPPTAEDLAALKAEKGKEKAAKPKTEPCPLINPTDEDAERLQASWNEAVKARWAAKAARDQYSYCPEFKEQHVIRITQARYSEHSKGTYCKASTADLVGGGQQKNENRLLYGEEYRKATEAQGPVICQVRRTSGENYMADRVIILIDKPQKPFPAALWKAHVPTETVSA